MILSWSFVYFVFAGIRLAYAQEVISRNLTTYTSATLELKCEILSDAVVVAWSDVLDDGSENELFILSVNDGQTTDRRQGDKYDNFDHTQNPTSFYNLIITDATKDDDGAYQCDNTPGGLLQYQVDVEVPGAVSIKNGSQDVDTLTVTVGEVYEITCSAKGTKSKQELFFDWEPDLEGGTVDSQQNADDGDLINYTITSTYRPRKGDTSITCQLNGYVMQEEIKDFVFDSITLNVRYKPECNMTMSREDSGCSMVILNCQCTAVPTEIKEYSFYNGSSLINTTGDNTITVDVDYDTTSQFSCQASNDEGTGEKSTERNLKCEEGTTAIPTTTVPTEISSSTPDSNTADTGTTTDSTITTEIISKTDQCICNYSGFIAACSIEAVLILVSVLVHIFFLAREWRGIKRQIPSRSEKEVNSSDVTENKAYMDLQGFRNEKNQDMDILQIPEQNVKMVSIIPGQGILQYHKALITRVNGNQDGVVRTLSDESTLSVIKILRSEVQHNIKLGNGKNIVKVLGWCDTVPMYVIFEHVNGRNLSHHIKEEFIPHRVHTYGNTEKRKFQVPEQGNIDILPKYALHVAKGIQFLSTNKFLHPGLRAKKILIDSGGNCKLYDFVSVKNANEWIRLIWNKSVPYQWMPPEFLFLGNVSSAGDIWSFGVLLWEIFSYGSEPYIGQTRSDVEKQIRQKELLSIPGNCPGAIWQLMIACWEPTMERRPKIDEITFKLASMFNADKEYQEIQ